MCGTNLWERETMNRREVRTDPVADSGVVPEDNLCGSGSSENGWLSYGFSSMKGKRNSMEDTFATNVFPTDGKIVGLFGVFDGHGGSRMAEYLKDWLFKNLVQDPKFLLEYTKFAITEAFKQTDRQFLQTQNSNSGSTAVTAIVIAKHLLVANVGDSRAVICRSGTAVAMSKDHKPNKGSDEKRRVEKAGGLVKKVDGSLRVGGILAVSRAFGDRHFEPYVISEPEIQEVNITEDVAFLILASDGLWDVISNENALSMVKEMDDAEAAATKLTSEAYRRGSVDNITCVVLLFNHGRFHHERVENVQSDNASCSLPSISESGLSGRIQRSRSV